MKEHMQTIKKYTVMYLAADGNVKAMFVNAFSSEEAKRKAKVRANGIAKQAKKNAGQAWVKFIKFE